MGLKGNVETISLVEIFQFIHGAGHSGLLQVNNGETERALQFHEGALYQASAHSYKLGNLLVRATDLTHEQLEAGLALQKTFGGRLGDVLIEAGYVTADEVRRVVADQFKEDVYDLFLWKNAHFEFLKDEVPEAFVEELKAGRAMSLSPPTILMEAVNRVDEWKRIRAAIPTLKLIYREVEGKTAEIDVVLVRHKIDKKVARFDGRKNLAQIFEAWKFSHFELYRVVFELLQAKLIESLPIATIRSNVEGCVAMGYYAQALRFYECAIEAGKPGDDFPRLDRFIFGPNGVGKAPHEISFNIRTNGKRALATFLALFDGRITSRFSIAEAGNKRLLTLTPDFLGVETWGSGTPSVVQYVERRGIVSREKMAEAQRKHEQSGRSVRTILLEDGYISEADWAKALTDKLVDEIADVFFWRDVYVEFSSRPDEVWGQRKASMRLQMPFSLPGFLDELRANLERVKRYLQEIPSVRTVFRDARGSSSPNDTLALFNGRRNLDDVLRMVRTSRMDFIYALHQGLSDGRVRKLSVAEYKQEVESLVGQERFQDAQRLCLSAIDNQIDPEHFRQRLEAARYAEEESLQSQLEGDFETISLAEILQSLYQRQVSGTLEVNNEKRNNTVYFFKGDVYVLRFEEAKSDFALDFLDESLIEQTEQSFGGCLVEKGLASEDEISEALATEIKEEIWGMFLWEGARFVFSRNVLPPEFHTPTEGMTRLRLNTGAFMLEAMRRINEWEELRRKIADPALVFRWTSLEKKMKAISEKGSPEVLYLLDGRRTIGEVVRVSAYPRTDVYRLIAELEDEGALARPDATPLAEAAESVAG